MDISYGNRYVYSAFEPGHFPSCFVPHQLVTQSPAPRFAFSAPSAVSGVRPSSFPTVWTQTTPVFHQHPTIHQELVPITQNHISPDFNQMPSNVHLQIDNSGGHSMDVENKSIYIRSATPNSSNIEYRNNYKSDLAAYQDSCPIPYINTSVQCVTNNITSTNNFSCPIVPLPKMPTSSFQVGYYVPPKVDPGDPYGGLNEIWTEHFKFLFKSFNSYRHSWTFGPTTKFLAGWATYQDMAKVRFSCQKCKHGWTSMHGVVVFYYHLDESNGHGEVRFVLTGQKCAQCNSADFETPMWYPEEAQKAMTNLYHEIASKVYRLETPPPIKERRHGRPRQQHVASSCQGCNLGICKQVPSKVNAILTPTEDCSLPSSC